MFPWGEVRSSRTSAAARGGRPKILRKRVYFLRSWEGACWNSHEPSRVRFFCFSSGNLEIFRRKKIKNEKFQNFRGRASVKYLEKYLDFSGRGVSFLKSQFSNFLKEKFLGNVTCLPHEYRSYFVTNNLTGFQDILVSISDKKVKML